MISGARPHASGPLGHTSTGRGSPLRRLRSISTALVLGAAVAATGLSTTGCRTSSSDIERWSSTLQGPRKLVEVITHAKYPIDLRAEAALALIRMKPRSGKRVGIELMLEAMKDVPPADRVQLLERMVPILEAEMKKPAPKAQGGQAVADPSVAFKDGAFALLSHDGGALVADEAVRQRLRGALTEWAVTDFAVRMDEPAQMFAMEQVMRALGAQGVRDLPKQVVPGGAKIDRMIDLIAELGDDDTKQRASSALVVVARDVDSPKWIEAKTPEVRDANDRQKIKYTQGQLEMQVATYQDETLAKIFTSMRRLGGAPVVDYLLEYAGRKWAGTGAEPESMVKRRATALAALDRKIDKNNPKQVAALLAIMGAPETPDLVRDAAVRRVGELPRPLVISALFDLFKSPKWKVRWMAAELALSMSDTSHIDEFFQKLGQAEGFSLTEPLRYGQLIGEMKGPGKPLELLEKHMGAGPAVVRMSALAYYFSFGKKADLAKLEPFAGDRTRAPECGKDAADCEWKCSVPVGDKTESKDVKTVGDYVQFCVKPAMEKRT
ncbi:MAG: hypothetical protein IT376_20105 [Polyangiaceae bacterium]|nr:hypothetical protein [Polyangiaceae bacterium]